MIDTSKDEINNKEITFLQPSKLVEGKQVACVLVAQIVSPTKRLFLYGIRITIHRISEKSYQVN